MKLIFLPADKYKAFRQDDTIALGMHSLVYRKYPKHQVCIIFAISQGKDKG